MKQPELARRHVPGPVLAQHQEEGARSAKGKHSAKPTLRDRLAGTKWVDTNNATFEWDAAGRLFRNGVESKYQIVDDHTIQVVNGDRSNKLVFDKKFTRFDQYDPEDRLLFQGKRIN